jgi:hypothetical protein
LSRPGVFKQEKKNEEIHEIYFETMSSLALRLVQVSLSESLFSSVGSSVPFVRERSGVRTSQGAEKNSFCLLDGTYVVFRIPGNKLKNKLSLERRAADAS